MKIVICDDCMEDALQLRDALKNHDVRIHSSAEQLLVDMEKNQVNFDLYLIDIYIENSMNGIELAERIRTQDKEAVICFISTSDAFYREAYDLYAIQYLLKPVREDDLNELLEKVSRNLIRDREKSLFFKWHGQMGTIPYGKILYISSREHTLYIYCKDGSVQECTGKLNEMALRLCGDTFCRCHQSFLVNLHQVDSLRGSDLVIAGNRIPVSRRYYAEVKRRYQEILFEEVE